MLRGWVTCEWQRSDSFLLTWLPELRLNGRLHFYFLIFLWPKLFPSKFDPVPALAARPLKPSADPATFPA